MMDVAPGIAVVIVCHNAADDLSRCLAALDAGTLKPACIVVVDSGSSAAGCLDALAKRPDTRCIRAENIGYGPGNNLGFAAVPPHIPLVLFLNPDCFVLPDTLAQAASFLAADENKTIAAVSPRLCGYDRNENCPTGLLDSTGIVRRWYGRWQDRGQGEPDDGPYDGRDGTAEAMPALCGAFLLCRRAALNDAALAPNQVFDPAFFLYKEDIELSLRLRKKGWKLAYQPQNRAWHCRGWNTSRKAVPRRLRLVAAANEIRLYLRHPSPYILWALAKYVLVLVLNR